MTHSSHLPRNAAFSPHFDLILPHPALLEPCASCLQQRDWLGYLTLFGSHERFAPFKSVEPLMTDSEYWSALMLTWTTAEWSVDYRADWRRFFLRHRTRSGTIIADADDRETWDKQPTLLTIYRGQRRASDAPGLSWTLSRDKACWFAKTYRPRGKKAWCDGAGAVLVGTVAKNAVVAFTDVRNEKEVIVDPDGVSAIRFEAS